MEKVLKGKCFSSVEEVKQKMAEALKGIRVQNCCEQWKRVSIGAVHQMESTLKMTEV